MLKGSNFPTEMIKNIELVNPPKVTPMRPQSDPNGAPRHRGIMLRSYNNKIWFYNPY